VRVRFLRPAIRELREAVRYYDGHRPELGGQFLAEVKASTERLKAFPTAWQPLGPDLRRCQLHRFPYGLIYEVGAGEILIIAVAHLHRSPDYWRSRVE
jgi:toxin ParE2